MKTINYKVSYEKMISRLPGLFAYLDKDEFGNMSLYSASESINGCYGKIVADIKIPNNCGLSIDGIDILKENETYTFRTIISNYYEYRKLLEENGFINFVEKGIGKEYIDDAYRYYDAYVSIFDDKVIKTPEEYSELSDAEKRQYRRKRMEYSAMPHFVYLSNVKNLYNEVVKMGKQCKFYQEHKEEWDDDADMCCLCERYRQMGGDIFRDILYGMIDTAESRAAEYFGYAQDTTALEFDVDLNCSYDDLGIMTPYLPQWLPYKEYSVGERVIYNNNVEICAETNSGVVFDETKWKKANNAFEAFDGYEPKATQDITLNGFTDSKLKDLKRFATYVNLYNVAETPQQGYDWLFYYRKGLILNVTTLNDELGNIIDLKTEKAADETGKYNLAAYGDVIDDITANKEDNTITFTYRLGTHLIGDEYSSYIDEDGNIFHYWGELKPKGYLRTTALEDGMITFNILKEMGTGYIRTISYSRDNGETWNDIRNFDNKSLDIGINVAVSEGESILWKGDARQTGVYEYSYGSFFSSTARFNVDGNVMSLCYGDDFIGKDELEYEGQFAYLFSDYLEEKQCKVVSAENLYLPSTLSEHCYYYMFSKCNTLVTAPKLNAITLAEGCYDHMFYYCSSLNYIRAMFTTEPGDAYTSNWVQGVSESGTFVKNSTATWDVVGNNGVPNGWTVKKVLRSSEESSISYQETYNYTKGSDLDKLVNGTLKVEGVEEVFTFEDYINGKWDDSLKYFKFEFITHNNNFNYSKTIANQNVNISTNQARFVMHKTNNDEFMEVTSLEDTEEIREKGFNNLGVPMFRLDYYNGITYAPTKDIEVNIERGSTSVFDKHIRFSEIKTLEDMEEYGGKFFSMTPS